MKDAPFLTTASKLKSYIKSKVDIYKDAKFRKDYGQVDLIRAALKKNGILVKDMKAGIDWAYEE